MFFKVNEEWGGLSNLNNDFPLRVNGLRISSSEALYQSCRFPHRPDWQQEILDVPHAMQAKMKAKKEGRRKDHSRPDWEEIQVEIMRRCLLLNPQGESGLDKFDIEAIDLAGELLNLRRDLWLFRTAYLPVLLRSASPELQERWQQTAQKLADAVPQYGKTPLGSAYLMAVHRLLCTGDPEDALRLAPVPSACFVLTGNRLSWHMYPYSGQGVAEREEQVRFVLRWAGVGDERAPAPWLELQRVLPDVQEFFASLPPTSDKKMGGYVAVLPILAELDPAFVVQAMDRTRLVAAVEGDPALTPAERERQLTVLSSRFYAGCLCNGLALVLEALANNHFAEIAPLLGLPEAHVDSFWAGLMPKILLATLYWKAVVLQELTQGLRPGAAGRDNETTNP